MKIAYDQTIRVENNLRSIELHIKVRDEFVAQFKDDTGRTILDYEGYVPNFFPGLNYGDYLILHINPDTGQIMNWDAQETDVSAFIEEKLSSD